MKRKHPSVRLIFRLFLDGQTPAGICRQLEAEGIRTPSGKQKWSHTTVNSILRNEKYKGDALLQKKFTVDFLTKKMKANEGEVPQYYVADSHPAIICPEEFDMVQAEIQRRKALGRSYSGSSVFSSKLVCADCGGYYGQKVWHSNDKYRRIIWRCNAKFNGKHKCTTPHLTEDEIKTMFLKAYNQLMGNREQVISDCRLMLEVVSDYAGLDTVINKVTEEIVAVSEQVGSCIRENATKALSQEEYNSRYDRLIKRYQKAVGRLEKLNAERVDRQNRERELRRYIDSLKTAPLALDTWDEQLWTLLVEKGIVQKDGSIEFEFNGGERVEANWGILSNRHFRISTARSHTWPLLRSHSEHV